MAEAGTSLRELHTSVTFARQRPYITRYESSLCTIVHGTVNACYSVKRWQLLRRHSTLPSGACEGEVFRTGLGRSKDGKMHSLGALDSEKILQGTCCHD